MEVVFASRKEKKESQEEKKEKSRKCEKETGGVRSKEPTSSGRRMRFAEYEYLGTSPRSLALDPESFDPSKW